MKIATLHHIRHFDSRVPPIHSSRFKGKGGLFRVASVLNDVRFAAETAVQYVMLEGLISDEEAEKSSTPKYTTREKWDVRFQFWRGVVEEELRYREEGVEKPVEVEQPVATPPSTPEAPPKPFEEQLGLYALPTRERRYAGLPTVMLEDEEGGFEPVPLPDDPAEAAAVRARAEELIRSQADRRAAVDSRLAEQRQRSQQQFDQRVRAALDNTRPVENPQFVTSQGVPGFPTSVPSGRIGGRNQ